MRFIRCILVLLILLFPLSPARSEPVDATSIKYRIDEKTPAWGAAPDGGNILADGKTSKVAPAFTGEVGAGNDQWVEFAPNAATPPGPQFILLHFDLGEPRAVSSIRITYYKDIAANLRDPIAVEVSYSADKVTFTDPVKSTPVKSTPGEGKDKSIYETKIDLKPPNASRYVDVQIDLDATSWAYLSELTFETSPAASKPSLDPAENQAK